MKKNIFKCLAYCLTAAVALTFGACSSDEHYDVTGNPDNLVYLHLSGDNTRSYKVTHTPVSHLGAFDAKFPVNILRAADSPTTVSVVMDNSLVEQYNAANGTSYVAVPNGVVNVTNNVAHIQANSFASGDSISISVPESALPQLTEEGYIIPFRISEVQGSGKISEERGVAYIIINTIVTLVNADATEPLGTMIGTDVMSTWTATNSSGGNANIANMLQESSRQTWAIDTYVVDMKEVRNVSSVGIQSYYGQYGYMPDHLELWLSKDGNDWTYIGYVADGGDMLSYRNYGYLVMYGGFPARYLKMSVAGVYNNYPIQAFRVWVE